MIGPVLIGLAAGCASALMFASIHSGAPISLVLNNLAQLPLMVAAIAWGPLAAAIGGIAACLGLSIVSGTSYSFPFAVAVALPAWWLGHLVMLGRPADPDHDTTPDGIDWYPLGRILLWIAGFAALTTLMVKTDYTAMAEPFRGTITAFFNGKPNAPSDAEIEQIVSLLVWLTLATAAPALMPTLVLNLWLSAKIAAMSGRLRRPWPDLKSTSLPSMTLAVLCADLAVCSVGGLSATPAKVIASALMMAYALTGFAVLHTLTSALKSRSLLIGLAYIASLLLWPLLAMVLLGIADAVFGLRLRYWRTRPPPLPTT